mgnify:CR=1 FL=1
MENIAMPVTTVLIMGAAGRDFHNFNVVFRDRPPVLMVDPAAGLKLAVAVATLAALEK